MTNATRLEAEASGRHSAQAAFDRILAYGYSTASQVFREIGVTLLAKWVRDEEMSDEVSKAWLASALAQFDALIADHERGSRVAVTSADPFPQLRDTASGTIRKLGLSVAASQLSPNHRQHVLANNEAQM
ncbi:hypothetical protein ACRAWG_06170 [Methylobacterium sp. P31]